MGADPEAPVRPATAPVGTGPDRTRADWLAPAAVAVVVGLILLVTGVAGQIGSGGGGRTGPSPPEETLLQLPGPGRVLGPTDVCPRPVLALVPGASLAAQTSDQVVAASFWFWSRRFVLCTTDAGQVTARRIGSMSPRLTARELSLTTIVLARSSYFSTRRFVAGGPLPAGVAQIAYTFPDTERLVTDTLTDDSGRRWWLMDYLPTTGVLTDPRLELADIAPVHVVVTRTDSSTRSYTLPWRG